MQKIVIIDKNINYIQNIMCKISTNIADVKIHCFYLEEDNRIINLINQKEVDILIINAELNQLNVIEYIYDNNIELYNKSIIILYNDIHVLKKVLKDKYAKYIFKCVKFESNAINLLNTLCQLVHIKENNYEKITSKIEINNILKEIGFNSNYIGTQYLIDIIQYIKYNHIEKIQLNVLYNIFSKKYHKSENTVKGNIRDAYSNMKNNIHFHNKQFIINYFNYLELIKFPTVKEIILTICEKIC